MAANRIAHNWRSHEQMALITGQIMTWARRTGGMPGLVFCVLLGLSAQKLHAQATPPGTVIRNWATVTYETATGLAVSRVSDTAAVTVGSAAGIAVTLVKGVDRATGTLGDIVTYSLAYQALGSATATNLMISDALPAGALYVPASIRLDGAPLTDAAGDDAGEFDGAGNRMVVTIPAVTGGSTGTITFQGRLDGATSPSNVARADYTTPLGLDSAASNAVQTTLVFASLSVAKLLDSPAIARVGEDVLYRIRYDNPAGSVVARNVTVTDSLPAGLQYVSATPPATVAGSALTWALGDIAAGTTAEISLQTRVAATLPDSVTVINTVSLAADNAPAIAGGAPSVLLLLASSGQLALEKQSDLLEVSLGETAPYTLTLENTGATALSDIRVSDYLPEGSRYSRGSALGADSVSANGRDLTFYVAGPLAPGAIHRVRYGVAVVSAERDVLENTAIATAQGGMVQSAPARAWVRMRRSWPLETRAAIGKVFVDLNGNGRQDGDEPGVRGVDVWTDDGELASTDADGRFSFQNLRPGRHAYRLDPATLPSEYGAPSAGAQVVALDGSGWTTPRVTFALVPRPEAAAAPVRLAVPLRFTARPMCGSLDQVLPGGRGGRAAIAYFRKNDSRPHYVLEPAEIGRRMRAHLADRPDCVVEIVGHTDSSDVHGGPFWSNERLAAERARWVGYELHWTELQGSITRVFGRGDREPQPGSRADSLARNRRVELRLVTRGGGPAQAEYEVVLTNPYEQPLHGIALTFDPATDAVMTVDGAQLERTNDGRWAVPTISAGSALTLRARAPARPTAAVVASVGSVISQPVIARLHNPLQPTDGMTDPIVSAGPPPQASADTTAAPAEPVTVPPLRNASDRTADLRRTLTAGPGVTVFAPADGAVLPSDRVFVGVRGEPGAAVSLFDGATLIANGELRGDGVHDFIAVPLARGPHRLRVRMMNSWRQERWDSLHVHVSGRPARFVTERAPVALVADGQSIEMLRVRVLDGWDVPVTSAPFVTVLAEGAEIVNADEDGSSVGVQVRADTSGWLMVRVRGGRDVRPGSLALRWGDVGGQVPLEILPVTRPLMLTAVGQVGLGAAPDAFGAATARGRLDARTSITLSLDSRQLDAGREEFGRSVDPLSEARYPILGDASIARTHNASRYALAARVERGMDWLALGDLSTSGFAGGLALSGYDRALSGVAGRVTTGAVVWQGFGSTSSERLAQLQIRGRGMSGPYDLAPGLRMGTERVAIETRALDNAQRTLARQVLARYVDYQIDYEQGLLLFKQPVPATDPSGNPLFIVVTYEAEDGGAPSTVWGLRASADARDLFGRGAVDSMRFGSTFIRDGRPGAERELAGIDFSLVRFGRASLRGELVRSQSPDSMGFATNVEGSLTLANGLVSLSAGWLHADDEFHNPANTALTGGTSDLRLGARFAARGSEVRLEHAAQRFDAQGLSRSRSSGVVSQTLGTVRAEARVASDRFASGTGDDVSQAGELKLTWTPLSALSVWAEGRQSLGDVASAVQPDYLGAGARLRVSPRASFELNHRQLRNPTGAGYSVTTLGGRSDLGFGTEAWGSYRITGASAAHGAAVVGLNNRLRLGTAWTVHALFERRMGLNAAPAADPLRALPFIQMEEDYWSAALGAELLPASAPYRLSARGEFRDGEARSSRLLTIAGDVSVSRAFAVLSRQELLASDDRQPGATTAHRRFSSLTGVAFRPVGSDALNVLAKVELIDTENPIGGGVLATQSGSESRRIFAAEAIWSPVPWGEFAARYALRRTDASVTHADGVVQPLASSAEYAGARLDLSFARWLGVRGEARLLHERTSGTTRWDAAPQLVLRPAVGLEVAGGYRLGDLRDPDFAVRGGSGWFVTFGATVTEQSVAGLAGFWRARLSR